MDSSGETDDLEPEQPPTIQKREGSPLRGPGMAKLLKDAAKSLGSRPKSGIERKLLAYDMSGKWAKLRIRLFLNSMFVKSERILLQHPDYRGMFSEIPNKEGPEIELYKIFCDAIEDGKVCPGYKFLPCDMKYDLDDEGKNKVDIGLYKLKGAPNGSKGAPKDGRPNWIHQSMWIEFKKKGKEDDAFNDGAKGPFEVDSEHAAQVRGQLISYAEMAMNRQQRTHLYSVFIMHKFARLVRWDRAGAVVSEKFNYKAHPEIFGEFFWRFSHMTDEAQGYDPTAQLVNPRTKLFRLMDTMAEKALPEPFDYIRQQFKDSLKAEWPRYKLAVEDKEKGTCYFLVGESHGQSPDLVGRGTRTYVAIDVKTETFVHLKDQWRYASEALDDDSEALGDQGCEDDHNEMQEDVQDDDVDDDEMEDVQKRERDEYPLRQGELHLEGDILSHLNKTDVRNVPTLLCHGDVGVQVTTTGDIWKKMPARLKKSSTRVDSEGDKRHAPSKLVHYRLVEKEVGQPLSEFETSRNLVKLIYDCMIAHEDAVTLARVLHRDISSGNMIMYPVEVEVEEGVTQYVWTGLLNDWELSKPIASPGTAEIARRAGRTGTWQFMSVNILNNKSQRPTVQDELESFFYVLLYYGVRYLEHNCVGVGPFVNRFFDSYTFDGKGEYSCGQSKRRAMDSGLIKLSDEDQLRFIGDSSEPHPLNEIMDTMLSWFKGHYDMLEYERQLRQKSSGGPRPRAPARKRPLNNKGKVDQYAYLRKISNGRGRLKAKAIESRDMAASREAAANLEGHGAMRDLLLTAITESSWPLDDKVGDQLPKNYTSKRTRISQDSGVTAGQKREAEDILATAQLRKRRKVK